MIKKKKLMVFIVSVFVIRSGTPQKTRRNY